MILLPADGLTGRLALSRTREDGKVAARDQEQAALPWWYDEENKYLEQRTFRILFRLPAASGPWQGSAAGASCRMAVRVGP